jgi:hypothetical protein
VAIFSNPLSTTQNQVVGRFKPDHFTLSGTLTNRGAAACVPASSFTYLGEGLDLIFTLTAVRADGGTTTNYAGAWAKLDPTVFANYAVGALSGTTNLTPRISGSVIGTPAWTSGALSNVTLRTTVARAASPEAPLTPTQFGIAPIDAEGTAVSPLDLDVNGVAPTDHGKVGATTELRFGRLKLSNAFGSDRANLNIPVQAQYWSGLTWVTNTDDACTAFTKDAVKLTGALSASNTVGAGVTLTNGAANIVLSCPYATCPLATKPATPLVGSVGVCVDLGADHPSTPATGIACTATTPAAMPWLQGKWPPGANYDNDPPATTSFGVYSPESRKTVHVRELY